LASIQTLTITQLGAQVPRDLARYYNNYIGELLHRVGGDLTVLFQIKTFASHRRRKF